MASDTLGGHLHRAALFFLGILLTSCATPDSRRPARSIDETGKIPAAAFFSNPTLRYATLSPDGMRAAGVRSVGAEDAVVLVPIEPGDAERVLVTEARGARGHRASRRIRDVDWPNDETVLYSIETPLRSREDSWKRIDGRGSSTDERRARGTGLRARKTRLYVTDLGGHSRWLGRRWRDAEHSVYQHQIISWLRHDPEHFLVQYEGDAVRIRVDNGAPLTVETYPTGGVDSWVADHRGEIRIRARYRDWTTEKSLYYRPPGSRSWETLIEFDRFEEHGFWFAGYSEDPDRVFVYADRGPEGNRDKTALFEYDLARRELGREILADPDYDIDSGSLLRSPTDDRLLSISYFTEGRRVHVVDAAWKRAWESLLATFPDQSISVQSWDATTTRMLLRVASHRSPPRLYLYDRSSGSLALFMDLYPELAGLEHASMRTVHYEARDGRQIEGYVTRPPESIAPGPTIVVPHDGPANRDFLGWDAVAQFLAQRGFTVFQPNFRGSIGYGRAHERAGDREWGRKIQDDITDGVRWLVAQGVADPQRIGIYGRGFGGYAALMGLVKTPDLYRAGASLGGIADVLVHLGYEDGYFRQGSVNDHLIGDPYEDLDALLQNSPLEQAARIRAPVLLGHGTEDPFVHVDQSIALVRALRRAGTEVELYRYEGATNRFLDERHRIDFYRRLADFFERHLMAVAWAEDQATGVATGRAS